MGVPAGEYYNSGMQLTLSTSFKRDMFWYIYVLQRVELQRYVLKSHTTDLTRRPKCAHARGEAAIMAAPY